MNHPNFEQLKEYCRIKQISLSTQQELILKIIAQNSSPLSNVEILEKLEAYNSTANRMTIYRTLDYLIQHQLIHKIQSQNKYTSCQLISDHSCQILVCKECGKQIEIHSHRICSALKAIEKEFGFSFSSPLEIIGSCTSCHSEKSN